METQLKQLFVDWDALQDRGEATERDPIGARSPLEADAGDPFQSHLRQKHRQRPRRNYRMTLWPRIVGIDLGTTNSLVAYMKDGDTHGHSRA